MIYIKKEPLEDLMRVEILYNWDICDNKRYHILLKAIYLIDLF